MNSFFRPGDFSCHFYCRTRDKMDDHNTRGREFIETLWRDYAPLLDPDALQRARQNMPKVFWELFVAYGLKSAGLFPQLLPRTKQNKKGPDFFTVNPDVWLEAVMPEMGAGPDAMEYPELGVARSVPVDSFILRLRSVFRTKADLMKEYMNAGIIQPQQATVIAIGSALLPDAISGEALVPRLRRSREVTRLYFRELDHLE